MVRLITATTGIMALIASYASAFTITPTSTTFTRSASVAASPSAQYLMTDEEIDLIFNAATDCAESECSIDEVDNLISTLKAQQEQLKTRLALVSGMVEKLQHVNEKDDREVSEVRQYVRDFLRVFTNEMRIQPYRIQWR